MAFTYNKLKRRWFKENGSELKLGNRVLGQNGNYYLYNSDGTITKVGSIKEGLSKDYIAYKKKHNLKVNVALEDNAMKAGLINLYGKWRINTDYNTDNRVKNVDNKNYFKAKDGTWRNFDTGLTIQLQQTKDSNDLKKRVIRTRYENDDNDILSSVMNHGVVDGLLKTVLDKAGVDEDSNLRTASQFVGTGAYFIPVVGNLLSAADAVLAARRGDYGEAATDLAGVFLPSMKALRTTRGLTRSLGKTKVGTMERIKSSIMRRQALTPREKTLLKVNNLSATPENIEKVRKITSTKAIRLNNPLNRFDVKKSLFVGPSFKVGNNTARVMHTIGSSGGYFGLLTLGDIIDAAKMEGIRNNIEELQNEAQAAEDTQNFKNGILLGRMSYSDSNDIMRSMTNKNITRALYNELRDRLANNENIWE